MILGICPALPLPATGELATRQRLARGDDVRIVCFGDSITGVYYHTGGLRAWSHLLEHALRTAYPQVRIEVINAGVSGNTTAEALARMEGDVLGLKPHLVAVMFGMNDVVRRSPFEFKDNLKDIVSRAMAQGIEVVLMTPNTVHADDPSRSNDRLAAYADIVRRVGTELGVPVADCFRRYQEVAAGDRQAWVRLMSDAIHPNLHGHKLFAQEVAGIIIGDDVVPAGPPPVQAAFPHTRARLQAGQEVRVVAMQPYDVLVGPALETLWPQAKVRITPWKIEGESFAALIEEAKGKGWWAFRQNPALERPDLVILAVPAALRAGTEEEYFRHYSSVLNWTLSFGKPEWDTLVVLPSVTEGELAAVDRSAEAIAVDVISGADKAYLRRVPGDASSAKEILRLHLKEGMK
jgi:lysophospholipase L1-like esterase